MKEKIIYWACIIGAVLLTAWLIKKQTTWLDKWPRTIELEEEKEINADSNAV